MGWSAYFCFFFFFKQKTAYEMRISDWSSDVCSSDLVHRIGGRDAVGHVGDLAFVAAGRRITVPDARSSTRARDRGFGCAASGGAAAAAIVPAPVVAVAVAVAGEGLQFGDTAVEAADRAIKRTERIADV